MNEDIKKIGERIALARKYTGMTQEALAEKINIPRVKLAKWEAGLYNIKCTDLVVVASGLNVSADYLFGLNNVMTLDNNSKTISSYIGLDDLSIEVMNKAKKDGKADLINTINDIIHNVSAWQEVSNNEGEQNYITTLNDIIHNIDAWQEVYEIVNTIKEREKKISFLRLFK